MGWRRLPAAGLVLAVVCGCQGEHQPDRARQAAREAPAQIVEQMVLRESESGRLRWVLVADSALTYSGEERTLLRGVHVDFYGESGDTLQSTLNAREGEVDERRGNLYARGAVVVVTTDGDTLATEELRWDNARGKVISDVFVRLTRGGSVVTGVGIESDAELRSYVIRSRVAGALHEEDGVLDEF